MKKTITKPDGTTEVVEGSPDEIAEYERKLRGELKEAPPKKKDILKGQALQDEVRRMIEKYMEEHPQPPQYIFNYPNYQFPRMEHDPNCEIKIAERGWWSVVPPRCTCGLITYPSTFRIITTTNTGGQLEVKQPNVEDGGVWTSGYIQEVQ